jgi:hypothetical protein
MFFEHLDDQLKKEAATKVPVRVITAAILEAEQKFESFLSSGDRNQRLAFVSDQIEEICIRTASEAGIDAEIVTPRVMEHLAADMTDEIYQGIAGSEVNAPKAISPSEAIGGGPEAIQPGQPAPQGYENRYKNIDVKDKQEEWHKENRLSKSENQDFEYGGKVDDQSRPGSNKGTRYDADSFDPNEQGKDHKDKGYKMVGGEAGGDTNPESHKNIDTGNAKKVNPRSMNETEKNSSFSLAEAERYHALRQSGVSHDDAEYVVKNSSWEDFGEGFGRKMDENELALKNVLNPTERKQNENKEKSSQDWKNWHNNLSTDDQLTAWKDPFISQKLREAGVREPSSVMMDKIERGYEYPDENGNYTPSGLWMY